ncbi:MAG: ROK family transcriptional regulator [Roseburia sp.]|nr:ROK family transcriptional regulator [Roseburia sp.]
MAKGMNIESIKQLNRALVLQQLATQDSCSRVEIARKINLSKMAISNIINEFLERGLLEATDCNAHATRSAPLQLKLSAAAPHVLGILLHRNKCQAAVCNLHMQIIDSRSISLPPKYTAEELMDFIFSMTDKILQDYPDILGIGIGSIGPVNAQSGVILNPPQFNHIQNLAIVELFHDRYHLPTYLDHHYNCAALAEYYYGGGKDCRNLLYLGMTSGISLGVSCGGKLFSSHNGYSSEIGHVTVDCNGPVCNCGKRGCLTVYARPSHIAKAVAESPLIKQEMTFQEICDNSQIPAIDQILMNNMRTPLIYALSSTINLLNSDLILLGDDAALLPERYLGYLEQRLNEVIFTHDYHHISVRRAMLSKEYNAAMCASTVIYQIFCGNLPF